MKRSWIQRILVIAMLAVSTHHMQAAWYSSWGEFQNAVTTQWNSFTDWITSFWKKSPTEVQVGGYAAYKGSKEINKALTAFLEKLKTFLSDFTQHTSGQMLWSDFINKNRDFLNDLDSINNLQPNSTEIVGIPESINKVTTSQETKEALRSAFIILKSDVKWSDLQSTDSIKNIRAHYEYINNLAKFLQQSRTTVPLKYAEKLNNLANTMLSKPRNIKSYLPTFTDQDELLKLLRSFKTYETARLFDQNRQKFYNQLLNLYTQFLNETDPAPKILWITTIQI